MPLKDFVAAYNNTVEVCDEIHLAKELTDTTPRRLIIKNFNVSDDLVKNEFINGIFFSYK